MSELALKVLERFGLPTLIALGLGALLWVEMKAAREERANRFDIQMDYITDIRQMVKDRCPIRPAP
jgi:hypothetical protein